MIVISSIGLAGCGDGDDASVSVSPAPEPATEAATSGSGTVTEQPTTAPDPGTGTTTAPPSTGGDTPTSDGGGATTVEIGPGAVEAPVVDTRFTIDGARIDPQETRVPAYLPLDIGARSADGRDHSLRITTPGGPITLAVPAGGTASNTFGGLEPGEYPIAIDGQVTDARLVVVTGAGPDGG